ncbi:MAG: hypothetical protein VYC39_19635 [Myxococcota bacterium]|nr:hypothetical protein [Myxococcota bacterium]
MNELILGMALAFASHDTLDMQLVLETKPGTNVRLKWGGVEAVSSSTGAFHRFYPLSAPKSVPLNFILQLEGKDLKFELSPITQNKVSVVAYDKRFADPALEKILVSNFRELRSSLVAVFYERLLDDGSRPSVALLLNPVCQNCSRTIVATPGVLNLINESDKYSSVGGEEFQLLNIGDQQLLLAQGMGAYVEASEYLFEKTTTGTSSKKRKQLSLALIAGLKTKDLHESSEFMRKLLNTELSPKFFTASNYSEARRMYQYFRFSMTQGALTSNTLGAESDSTLAVHADGPKEADLLHYLIIKLDVDRVTHEIRSLHGGKVKFAGAHQESPLRTPDFGQRKIYLVLLSCLLCVSLYTGYRLIFGPDKKDTRI